MGDTRVTRVCGDCWYILRPDMYEPNTYIDGKCNMCGQFAYVHRVAKSEVRAEIELWNRDAVTRGAPGKYVITDDGNVEWIDE